MDQQWNSDLEGAGANRNARYTPQTVPSQQYSREPSTVKQEGYAQPSLSQTAPSVPLASPGALPSRGGGEYNGDGEGDIRMEDVDQYGKGRQRQHVRLPSSQLSQEESAAARRYSPMNLSPSSPYAAGPGQPGAQYQTYMPAGSARLSPTRSNSYMTPNHYYASPPSSRPHAPQLPPMNAALSSPAYSQQSTPLQLPSFAREPKSPVRANSLQPPSQASPASRGPVPKFTKCTNTADLVPKINEQPPFRRAAPEGGFLSPLRALTTSLPDTYRICNPQFKYESTRNPRRVLTKPSKGTKNDGYDNEDSDYILYVNDILGSEESGHKNRYLILDVLGQGTFGQVVKCQNLRTQEVVAVKVVKNRTAYFNQSMMEVSVLDLLNKQMDRNDDHHLLRLKDTFIHRQHLCLVFELLSVNLYELIKQNQFRGLSTTLVRVFAQQLLTGLNLLGRAKLIHCDLKPENILLKNLESPIIKIIDFGSACDERQTVYTYIQSRFYRSPEVLLGLPYSAAIDMWSLGCIVVELFLGLPLFPGSSEYNQVSRINEMLGLPPSWMLEMGKQSGEFFEKGVDEYGRRNWRLKGIEQYSREKGVKEQGGKKYFSATTLPEIVRGYPMPRKGMKSGEVEREMANRTAFIDFAQGLLNLNPLERWTPAQAKLHPFITQQKYTGPFVPPMTMKSGTGNKSPAPGVQEQQRAEAMSKQRAQQAAAAQAAQAQNYANMQMNSQGYPASPMAPQGVYGGMPYSPGGHGGSAPPPPYAQGGGGYGQPQVPMLSAQNTPRYAPQQPPPPGQNLYAQATTRAGRQRASTMELQNQGPSQGIPAALQRVMGHLDPNAPIRLQPSPAYYPPPPGEAPDSRRRAGQQGSGRGGNNPNRDFIRNLEDRTLEEGFMQGGGWQ